MEQVSDTCRFEVVCSRCTSSCQEMPERVIVSDDAFVPTCQPVR